MTTPLKHSLRLHLNRLRQKAETHGVDLWDALNQAGLLFTIPRQQITDGAAIRRALMTLDALPIPMLLGPRYRMGNYSALDMRKAISDRLLLIAEEMESDHVG